VVGGVDVVVDGEADDPAAVVDAVGGGLDAGPGGVEPGEAALVEQEAGDRVRGAVSPPVLPRVVAALAPAVAAVSAASTTAPATARRS